MDGKWTTKSVNGPYGVSLWKCIRNLWPKFMNKTNFSGGNGMEISFWKDNQLGQGSLSQMFPDIYILNQQQEATIGEVWNIQGWNFIYRRLLNDWEIGRLTEFYNVIEQFKGISNSEDRINWQRNKIEKFSVRSAYKEFNLSMNQVGCWPWKLIWKVKISHKVACFTRLLAKEAMLTQDNLVKRGYQLCSKCYLCGEEADYQSSFFTLQVDCSTMENFYQLKGVLCGLC